MHAALIFGPTERLARSLQQACAEQDDFHVYKVLHTYPATEQLLELMGVFAPEIVFLEIAPSEEVLGVLRELQTCHPRTTVVGFFEPREVQNPFDAQGAGFAEVLLAPFTSEQLEEMIVRVLHRQESAVPDNIIALLPAKAGSGSTTVALHLAGYLARDWTQKVLLIEADIHSGPLAFFLNLTPERSIIDALENCHWLQDTTWNLLVSKVLGFDLLPAPKPTEVGMILRRNCCRLMTFVRSRYDTVVVDLPEVINDGTEAIVKEARRVYVVCTPEKPSVLLARRRIHELTARGVKDSQVGVLLNRHTKLEASIPEIEEILGRQFSLVLPNDYFTTRLAMVEGRMVEHDSELGSAFCSFAQMVAGAGPPPAAVTEKKERRLGFLFRKRAVNQ